LVKRTVIPNPEGSGDRLEHLSAMSLLRLTRHDPVSARERHAEVRILDRFVNTACARVDASARIDYLHLARWNGRWVVVNVLEARRMGVGADQDDAALLRDARLYPLECRLHPELVKRTVGPVVVPTQEWPSSSWPPGDKLYQLSALSLVQGLGPDSRRPAPPDEERFSEARTILDRFENAASVRAWEKDGDGCIDYVHLARWNGQWLAINVLWELTPKGAATAAARDAAHTIVRDTRVE
jgi:hypothetical protein